MRFGKSQCFHHVTFDQLEIIREIAELTVKCKAGESMKAASAGFHA